MYIQKRKKSRAMVSPKVLSLKWAVEEEGVEVGFTMSWMNKFFHPCWLMVLNNRLRFGAEFKTKVSL
jgi:hypothetical protein